MTYKQAEIYYELRALPNGKYCFEWTEVSNPQALRMDYPDMTESEVRKFFRGQSYPSEVIDERLRAAQRRLEERNSRGRQKSQPK